MGFLSLRVGILNLFNSFKMDIKIIKQKLKNSESFIKKQYFVKIVSVVLLLAILILPAMAQAAWWNPFSWNIWQKISEIFYKPQVVQVEQQNKENKGQEVSEEQKTKNDKVLLEDVYPLYGDLEWSPITPKKAEGAVPIDGLGTKAELIVSGMQEGYKFIGYYENKLVKLGWEQDGNFTVDGVNGSQTGYKKGENRIVLGYSLKPGKIISGKNEPLQYTCPCKMTYSIFTTVKVDETTNWKTYTNTEYGFEFKYPDTLFGEKLLHIYSGSKECKPFYKGDSISAIPLVGYEDNSTYNNIQNIGPFNISIICKANYHPKVIDRYGNVSYPDKVRVGNIMGYTTSDSIPTTTSSGVAYYIDLNDKTLTIYFEIYDNTKNTNFDLVHRIISTFKFTETKSINREQNQNQQDQSQNKQQVQQLMNIAKTHHSISEYGIEFDYRASYKAKSLGPNEKDGMGFAFGSKASYESVIIYYSDPYSSVYNYHDVARIDIMRPYAKELSMENYNNDFDLSQSGLCDYFRGKFKKYSITTELINGIKMLKVDGSYEGFPMICYYFKNLSNKLVVFSISNHKFDEVFNNLSLSPEKKLSQEEIQNKFTEKYGSKTYWARLKKQGNDDEPVILSQAVTTPNKAYEITFDYIFPQKISGIALKVTLDSVPMAEIKSENYLWGYLPTRFKVVVDDLSWFNKKDTMLGFNLYGSDGAQVEITNILMQEYNDFITTK